MADTEKRAIEANDKNLHESSSVGSPQPQPATVTNAYEEEERKPWPRRWLELGHVSQIIVAAVIALAIGLGISAGVGPDNVHPAAGVLLEIPGRLWLRALQAVGTSIPCLTDVWLGRAA